MIYCAKCALQVKVLRAMPSFEQVASSLIAMNQIRNMSDMQHDY
jgi:hypothetical protein